MDDLCHTYARRSFITLVVAVALLGSCANALAAGGEPDSSFGTGGFASFALGFQEGAAFTFGSSSGFKALTVAPSGNIFAAGISENGSGGFRILVACVNGAGALNPEFAGDGALIQKGEIGSGGVEDDSASSIALAPDGTLLVGGPNHLERISQQGQLIARLPHGWTPFSALTDGDILTVAGTEVPIPEAQGYSVLSELLPSGQFNTAFGEGGFVRLHGIDSGTSYLSVTSFITEPDGAIFVGGSGEYAGEGGQEAHKYMWIGKLTPAGTVDTSYADDGMLYFGEPYGGGGHLIARPSGFAMLGPAAAPVTLWGFTESGAPDTSFGTNGVVEIPIAPNGFYPSEAITADAAGRLYVETATGTSLTGVTRLLANGQIDRTFGQNGTTYLSTAASFEALAIDPQGRLLAAGHTGKEGALERFTATSSSSNTEAAHPSPHTTPESSLRAKLAAQVRISRSVRRKQLLKHRGMWVSFLAPAPGTLTISWYLTRRSGKVLVAHGRHSFKHAGRKSIWMAFTRSGLRALRARHRVHLLARAVFHPRGAPPITVAARFWLGLAVS